ncbi:hypothetical protein RIR_jg22917.t1 [Rhizophagus irregularis DAOM 181602=DAOM 197198]|uniref:Uncharacterized protein n=1 Tax=Rhizophagus irregularis (strain DAOM 181602 / DAOM 197198 / MUCL 43194) TaxID=747089 RepID=U9TMV1_RHIID|nr:hypothetical protein RIR_jg22917.t1 [Rhizophagus irregularis DAOM 181602=DAOM 197198]
MNTNESVRCAYTSLIVTLNSSAKTCVKIFLFSAFIDCQNPKSQTTLKFQTIYIYIIFLLNCNVLIFLI